MLYSVVSDKKPMSSRGLIQSLTGAIAVLLVAIAYLAHLLGSQPSTRPVVTTVTNTVKQIAVRKITPTNFFANVSAKINWSGIESTNYQIYIANLRDIGCPEETVRDIIITDIAKLFARRRAALRTQAQPYKFWHVGDALQSDYGTNAQLQRQLQELDREQRMLVKQLLGVDYRTEMSRYWSDDNSDQRMYGFLPGEKQEQAKALQSKFDDMEQEVYARSKGMLLDGDQEQLRRIERQREAELAQLLSPAELEEYQLRNSSTANSMRAQLTGFDPNEEEFRKIFRLQKVFDDEFNTAFDATDDKQTDIKDRAQQAAQNALNQEMKKILGEKRFAEYERAQDADYRTLVQVGDRFELPREAVNRVYAMKQEAERQKLALEANANLTDEQRQRALEAIAKETQRSVAAVMGNNVFKSYFKTGGGWIRNLPTTESSVEPVQ
jgi:hypothetical protein